MDLAFSIILTIAVGLIGGAVAWTIRGRAVVRAEQERDGWRHKFTQAITDLAAATTKSERVGELENEIIGLRRRAEALAAENASHLRGAEERERAFQEQMTQIALQNEAMKAQFAELAAKALEGAQKNFLERADQRFQQSGTHNEERLKQLLAPVENTLKRYEEGIAKVEQERRESYGNLTGLIEAMRAGQEAVRGEAAKLVNALRSAPKARGRWGEQQLRNVLETCGLSEHTDFRTEVSVEGEDGRLRPDAIVRVPGGRALVIDAKVSLNAYQDAFAAVDESERARYLAAHTAAMKAHIDGLSRKAYWDQFEEAPDYVVMFVPGEHFLSAALEHDPGLWDHAFSRRVLLATPTNLIAIARTVAAVWRQEKLAAEAKAIGTLGKEMYDRLAVASGHLRKVGAGLNTAVNNYNSFVNSFDGRVLVTARRFRELNVETGAKEIEDIAPVETLAREPMHGREGTEPSSSQPLLPQQANDSVN